LVLFPNCKINLGLHVAGKRSDGYHDLETVFYPVPLKDAAEITTYSPRKDHPEFDLTITGSPIPGDLSSNLCTKAWQLIKKDFPDIPSVRMHLHKAIPIGGGLGGGSADGAFTLILLNDELKLNLTTEKLLAYALKLGSDCPFFILNKPCYATGRGENLEEINVSLNGYHFVIVDPAIHISTADAFHEITISKRQSPQLREIVSRPPDTWKDVLVNEFEEPVFKKHYELERIKQELYESGAAYASMTGTGSCIYGIFHNSKKTANLLAGEKFRTYMLTHSH
jgi:4-diphosphocytidyl-2-C-methyl-D-erythritol kinase